MALDKAIKYGKEFRKPYRRSAAFDPACRHHGGTISCPWCRGNKLKSKQIQKDQVKDEMNDA